MKPTESPAAASPAEVRRRSVDMPSDVVVEETQTEEQAFYAAQEVAFADLRAYHAGRPRRKR